MRPRQQQRSLASHSVVGRAVRLFDRFLQGCEREARFALFQTGLADADQFATDRARIAALARVEQGFRCLG